MIPARKHYTLIKSANIVGKYYKNFMNIKIEFKGKLHKLATGLTSLEDIHKDILARYSPKYFASGIVLGYINNNAVTRINSFEELLDLAKNQQGSLKLKAFEAKEFEVNKI